jgi:hypothetical protein
MSPPWLALLAPLPDDAVVDRRPVASPDLVASGQADAIAGWESLTVHLSDAALGLRHVLLTLDATGTLISGGDGVMLHRQEQRGADLWHIYHHENIGGRFEPDGSFHGTRWRTRTEQLGDDEAGASSSSVPGVPSAAEVDRLRALAAWVIARAPKRPG